MVIDGRLDSININGSFDMKDTKGVQVFNVSRNKYMKDKVYITSPSNNIEYLGEIIQNTNSEEFVLYEDEIEILRIKQTQSLGAPKFHITSPFGDYKVKIAFVKFNLSLLDGGKEVLSFKGTPNNYTLNIDDNCNVFYVISITYGIFALLNIEE